MDNNSNSDAKIDWGPWTHWPMDRDPMTVPSDIAPGNWVESDLIRRPGDNRFPEQPDIIASHEWQVIDATSFMIAPPPGDFAAYAVLSRYRVWRGKGSPFSARSEDFASDRLDLDEEELPRRLWEAMGELEGNDAALETCEQLDWLKEKDPGAWWHAVEARIGMSDEDYADHVAECVREVRSGLGTRET